MTDSDDTAAQHEGWFDQHHGATMTGVTQMVLELACMVRASAGVFLSSVSAQVLSSDALEALLYKRTCNTVLTSNGST